LLEKHGVSKPALNAATSDDLKNCLEPNTYPNGDACDKVIETGNVGGRQVTDDEMGQAYIQQTNTLGLTGATYDADLLTQRVELVSKGIDYLEKGEDISLIRWGYFNRSGLYEELEQHKKAIADINTYIAMDGPYISNALSSRAKAYLALGKRKLAISDYKKAIELAGDPVAETIARLALQQLEE
jgi:tetratricopeptide (TPR) repeat protein